MADRAQSTLRLPTPGRRTGRRFRPGETLVRVGIILLSLGLIAYAIYQAARHVTTGLNVLRTQEITDDSYVSLDLYLFRDEQVLNAPGGNVFLYGVQDGEKVPAGQSLASAYVSFDGDGIAALQRQLNAYGRRIELLKRNSGQGTLSDAQQAAAEADGDYAGMLTAARTGNLGAMSGYAQDMLDTLNRYDILVGSGGGGVQTVAGLTAERNALVAGLIPAGAVSTDRAGWFYYTTDGYETVFDYSRVLTMTPAEFRTMIASPAGNAGTATAGKMVYTSTWYAAAYIPLTETSCFRVGETYDMLCNDSADTVIAMKCVRMEPDSEGALLVFSTQAMPAGFAFDRRVTAETVYNSVSGYRIPTGAVVTLKGPVTGEDITGVYVLEGNRVVFRRILILIRRDGYLIARTYEDVQSVLDGMTEEDAARISADGWSFLQMNDNVITGGNGIYEGKMIS